MAGEAAGLDVHGGDDEDAAHASAAGGPLEVVSAAAGPACLRFSQAAYELPAAVSRPVNAMLSDLRVGDGLGLAARRGQDLNEGVRTRRAGG